MKSRLDRYLIVSFGALLFITAAAKLISSGGNAKLLDIRDAVLGVHFRYLFLAAGVFEMAVALVCLFGKNILLQAKLVAWLSLILLIYRIGLSLLGASEVCGCLGTLTSAINLPPQTADFLMKIVLGYLLAGSSAILLLSWRNKGKNPAMLTPV